MSGSRRRGVALLALAVLLGAAAVAAGAGASRGGGSDRRPSEWLLDVAVSLLLVAMVPGAVLAAAMLVLRPRELDPSQRAARWRGRMWGLVWLVALLGLVALGAREVVDGNGDGLGSRVFGDGSPTEAVADAADGYEPEFATAPVLVVLALVALAVVGWGLAWRTRRREMPLDESLSLALEELLDDSVDDLRAERDPRRAVIATYARLEAVLASHGVPRRPSEAPLEYLSRVLASLELSRRAVTRLTALFETAKFSQHEIDTAMKEEAIDALVNARDELRAARERAEQERAAALERAGGQVGA